MSHIIFGDFNCDNMDKNIMEELRREILIEGILIYFNEDIDFYNDVNRMICENYNDSNNITFCLTSVNQKYNSDDLLFPYDKYEDNELFPDGEERVQFESICFENLMILEKGIALIIKKLRLRNLRVFVTHGYDDNFVIVKCNVDEMFRDIRSQVISSFNLKSKVYELK